MFSNKLKVKNSRSNFNFYHGAKDEKDLKKLLDKEITLTSIDVGIKNFAIRIEEKSKNGITPVLFEKIDFREKEGGEQSVSGEVLNKIVMYLESRKKYIFKSNIVMIERQLAVNYKSSCVMMFLISYFMSNKGYFEDDFILFDVNSKFKNIVLKSKSKRVNDLKKASIEHCLRILKNRKDDWSYDIVMKNKGKSKTKADDLADTVVQLESLYIWNSLN